jgi:hypothetical protein
LSFLAGVAGCNVSRRFFSSAETGRHAVLLLGLLRGACRIGPKQEARVSRPMSVLV